MATAATECLYTTVIHIGDQARAYGFLGDHGRRLEPGEQFTHRGDLGTTIAKHPRKFKAMERALAGGEFAIMKTPAVHLYDSTLDETKVVTLVNGTLGKADPCTGDFSSSIAGYA